MMASRPKQYTSIQDGAHNPRQTPPCLSRAFRTRVPAKVKAHAEAGEVHRTRVLNVKRVLKGVNLQPSAPELDERKARLCEKQSLNLFHLGQTLQAVVTFISSRE
jgi:hypothetical protein